MDPAHISSEAELAAARHRIASLETELEQARRKHGLRELAPQWIAAITGVVAALTSVGFFAGKAVGSNDAAVQPSASASVRASIVAIAPTPTAAPSPTPAGPRYLSAEQLPPPQGSIGYLSSGSVEIGAATYSNSIRFTCSPFGFGTGSITFDVAGFAYFDATVGVPNDAKNATGNSMTITFFKDGETQLDTPLTIVVGKPKTVHLALQETTQLQIQCGSKSKQGLGASMDAALGDASLTAG
jgi:hypothetical protein